jgi:hypothetical protein
MTTSKRTDEDYNNFINAAPPLLIVTEPDSVLHEGINTRTTIKIAPRTVIFIILLSVVVFFISGYWLSDEQYFNHLIEENRLETPEQSFDYVTRNIDFPGDLTPPGGTMTPRYMLEKKHLWCDQGAIVVATFAHQLGFPTRLVDIGDEGNVTFGHTYLQVYENGEWKNYDTVLEKSGITQEQILEGFNHRGLKVYTYPRPYPNLYNRIIQKNFYIKHFALALRNGPG